MKPSQIMELQELVSQGGTLAARGGGSKPSLSAAAEGFTAIDLSGLAGMLEYQPGEFTFTALAGTPLAEIDRELAGHGQFLPFDPPLAAAGATLGGTVAAGLSGSGRYRYGGVRDFVLGVKYLDGQGRVVRGGGKVVKNSAGFDLPKLMVGSLGAYGPLVELSFKVFPRPAAFVTLRSAHHSLEAALLALVRLSTASLDLFALDLQPTGSGADLLVRLGGLPGSFPARIARLQKADPAVHGREKPLLGECQILEGEAEAGFWLEANEFSWAPATHALVKVPLTPQRAPALDARLAANSALRRYIAGANLAWVAWPGALADLDRVLCDQELSGLVLRGQTEHPRLGVRRGEPFARRVKQALDPLGRWREI